MKRRFLAALLSLSMALVAVGCGGGNESSDAGSAGGDPQSVLKDGENTELLVVFPNANTAPASLQKVEDGLNEIIAETMDATVKFQIIDWGSYGDQTNLMLSSGEKLDLFFTMSGTQDMVNKGQLYPLTDLIDDYAPEVKEIFGDYLEACKVGGELYGLPNFRDLAVESGLVCRKDILDEIGVKPEDVKTWDDVEGVLQKVKETHPEIAPLIPVEPQQGMFKYMTSDFDEIQMYSGVGCFIDENGDGEVVSLYETEEYKELAERAYDWNEKGYFIADATTLTNTRQDLMKAGKGFGWIGGIHPGTVTQETMNAGTEVVTMPIVDRVTSTTRVNGIQWTIPTNCENPEKALAFLNILYSNPDAQNLFRYGIEGEDYIVTDAENGIAAYPEGKDYTTVGWTNESWITGNPSVGYAWETDPENVWDAYKEYNDTAVRSPLYGFVFDSSNVKNEITAVYNVAQKYRTVVESGYADVEETLEKFNAELKDAGVDKIIDEANKQIEEWKNN